MRAAGEIIEAALRCVPLLSAAFVLAGCNHGSERSARGRQPPSAWPVRQRVCLDASAKQPDRPLTAAQIESLRGTYDFTVVGRIRVTADSIVKGELTLSPTDSVHRYYTLDPNAQHWRHREPTFLLAGWTTVDLRAVGAVGVVSSPSSRNPDSPGVQVDERGVLVVGNSVTPRRGPTLDAGVLFVVRHIDESGFSGIWTDGSTLQPTPHGYFCAFRVNGG